MGRKISGEKVEESSSYRDAKASAADYARDPARLQGLLDRAKRKARAQQRRLAGVWDALMAAMRLLRAYARGDYRDIPWSSLLSIIATVIYFVTPLDLIPDFLLAFGLLDDAALIGWILNSLKGDIDRFVDWERAQSGDDGASATDPGEDDEPR